MPRESSNCRAISPMEEADGPSAGRKNPSPEKSSNWQAARCPPSSLISEP